MEGSNQRVCANGVWSGQRPVCFGLNQENDYARTIQNIDDTAVTARTPFADIPSPTPPFMLPARVSKCVTRHNRQYVSYVSPSFPRHSVRGFYIEIVLHSERILFGFLAS